MYKQQHYFGTACHPNSNSVDRAHRSLLNSIRAELSDQNWTRAKWVECLPKALANLRMAPDESHSCAFSRVFGLPARTGISQIAPTPYDRIKLVPTQVISETDKEIKVENQDPETGETKVTDSLFADKVNCINNINCVSDNVNLAALPLQEFEQAKKDVQSEQRQRYNKLAIDGKIRRFLPFKAELVNRVLVQDEQSLDSRKFQRTIRTNRRRPDECLF